MSVNVRVITPERIVWDANTEEVVLPSLTGRVGVLDNHAPLMTGLGIGVVRVKEQGDWNALVLIDGFAEVKNNTVTILCTQVEDVASIDVEKAQADVDKLTPLVSKTTSEKERIDVTIALRKASARLQAVKKTW